MKRRDESGKQDPAATGPGFAGFEPAKGWASLNTQVEDAASAGNPDDIGPVLVVDIGNTRTVIGWFNTNEPAWTDHWMTHRDDQSESLPIIIQSIIVTHGEVLANLSALVIASVVPNATQELVDALASICTLKPIQVSSTTAGIQILVDYPERVGADRIANAVAASLYPLPVLVMDTGTATTLTVVDSDGSLIGGTISLGLLSSARALHQMTAQLPLSDLARPTAQIGRNTEDSIRSGLLNGTAAMLEGMADRIASEMNQNLTLVLTGGNASRLLPHFRRPLVHDPHLLLKGLYLIAITHLNQGSSIRKVSVGQPQIAKPASHQVNHQTSLPVSSAGLHAEKPLGGKSIGLIGAGRLGVTFGAYLAQRGFCVSGYASLSLSSTSHAARVTGSKAFPSLESMAYDSEVILITTPDDKIAGIVRQLAEFLRDGHWLMHCSGSLAASLIRSQLTDKSASVQVASIHPMFAFSHRDGRIDGLETSAFAI